MSGSVLGLTRTGLIFTGLQEGAQPGGLTQPQPGQTEPGIPYHVPSCWVPVGGRRGGNSRAARERAALVLFRRAALWVVRFVSCFLLFLYRYCSCSLLFAVLLNCPYPDPPIFCLFISILLHTPVGGGAAAWRFCCRRQPKPKQGATTKG